ncbi:MAG TPA: hypothetical protein VGC95_04810, partial [Chitinophagaceae bacterium]
GQPVNNGCPPALALQMATTPGYSGKSLTSKLGIAPGLGILLINHPTEYFEWVGEGIKKQVVKEGTIPDIVHVFGKDKRQFENAMQSLQPTIRKNRKLVIWVSWYKKSSGISTDLTEDVIRNFALKHDLVDVKVCAVSDQWSGLKLVVPLNKR